MEGVERIEYMELEEVPYAVRNPKDHDIGAIISSIKRFGYVDPGLIDERTGRLLVGNGRKEALLKMRASGEDRPKNLGEGWEMPIIRGMSSGDDEEAEAYLIADNRLTELGGWDERGLVVMLSEMRVKGEEMLVGVGYDGDDIDEMWRKLKGEEEKGEGKEEREGREQDYQPEYEVEEGDIWKVGDNFIVCGDCRAESTWEQLFSAAKVIEVNGIMTSPPYAEQRKGKYPGIPADQYVEWFKEVQRNMRRGLAKDGSLFLNIKANVENGQRLLYVNDLVKAMNEQWGWVFVDEYCWLRNPPPGSWPNRFKNGFEPVYHFGLRTLVKFLPENVKGLTAGSWDNPNGNVNTGGYYHTANSSFDWDGSLPSNVLDIRANVGGVGHSAAFPLDLPRFFVKAFSEEEDVWVDPFMGSGSTILACWEEGRIGLGIEVVPELASIAITRLAKEMDTEPEKIVEKVV